MNDLTHLIKAFPDKNWDWYLITSNPNSTLKLLLQNIEKGLDLYSLSNDERVTIEFILDHPEIEWVWYAVSQNNNVKLKHVLENRNLPWNVDGLLLNRNIKIKEICRIMPVDEFYLDQTIQEIIDSHGDYIETDVLSYIMDRSDFTIDIVLNNINLEWNWCAISAHRNITWNIIVKNINLPWEWSFVSSNENITIDIVRDNQNMNWHWIILSRRFALEDIFANMNLKWNFEKVINRDDCTPKYVEEYPILQTYLRLISENNYNWKFSDFAKYPIDRLNWYNISANPNITFMIMCENPGYPWSISGFSKNPNLTHRIVMTYTNLNWNWENISKNEFSHNKFFRTPAYRKERAKRNRDIIWEELVKVSCMPKRIIQTTNCNDPEDMHPLRGLTELP